jgi:hypothetical protein
MMTVGELMEVLAELDPYTPVIISPDAEGNNIHYASGAGIQLTYDYDEDELQTISPSDTEEIQELKDEGYELSVVLEVW